MSLTPSLAPSFTAGSSARRQAQVMNQAHTCMTFTSNFTAFFMSNVDLLPVDWRKALRDRMGDQQWIAKALFVRQNKISDAATATLWWHPPTPLASTKPNPEMYVLRRLFLWMPRRTWAVNFKCPFCSDCSLQ